MEIIYKNLAFNRIVGISNVTKASSLSEMDIDDIHYDNIVSGENLNENEKIFVFQNKKEPFAGERYCYIKTRTIIGGDGQTRMIIIEKVITDMCFIIPDFFLEIFTILLQQESGEYSRIVVGIINDRFYGRIYEIANRCSQYLCDLYTTYLNDYDTPYTIEPEIPIAGR